MKTIYLTILFLLLGILTCGCGEDDLMMLSADNGDGKVSYNEGNDIYATNTVSGEDAGSTSEDMNHSMDGSLEDNETGESADGEIKDGDSDRNIIYVFVCGHVVSPGVYELVSGDRIYDALALAGGVTEDGRAEALEQAMPVSDGQTIYVPGIDEEWERPSQTGTGTADNTDGGLSESAGGSGLESSDCVNINTASKEELMTLPGIGESKASDIIRYREEHGSFNSIEELMNIQGIKEGVFSKVKDRICV